MRWGLLSTARINHSILDAGNADVVAVASRDAERAAAYAREHGIARAHGSYAALLADPDVDIIYNSLPNHLHLPWAIRALEAGKHVLCEKPLARRAADVEAAYDVAERCGRVLVEGFMWRHHPQVAQAQELIAGGAIGRLRLIRSAFAFPLLDAGDVRLRTEYDGGSLMDLGCYCVSAARTFAGGEPLSARADAVRGGDGVDVALTGLLRFADDVQAVFDCAFVGPGRDLLELIGDAGALRFADPWHARGDLALRLTALDGTTREVPVPAANHYTLQVAAVEAAARGERLAGRAEAVGQARAIELLLAAAG